MEVSGWSGPGTTASHDWILRSTTRRCLVEVDQALRPVMSRYWGLLHGGVWLKWARHYGQSWLDTEVYYMELSGRSGPGTTVSHDWILRSTTWSCLVEVDQALRPVMTGYWGLLHGAVWLKWTRHYGQSWLDTEVYYMELSGWSWPGTTASHDRILRSTTWRCLVEVGQALWPVMTGYWGLLHGAVWLKLTRHYGQSWLDTEVYYMELSGWSWPGTMASHDWILRSTTWSCLVEVDQALRPVMTGYWGLLYGDVWLKLTTHYGPSPSICFHTEPASCLVILDMQPMT